MAENADNGYAAYPVFKGLQKPLEFLGIQGRYIYWAAGAAQGASLQENRQRDIRLHLFKKDLKA